MLKRLTFFLISTLLVVNFSAFTYAQEDKVQPKGDTIETREEKYAKTVNNLGRGIGDSSTFWAELPQGMIDTSKRDGPVAGMTVGFVEGMMNSARAGINALYELLTFFVPK
jgi:putative exosortase-associated protein (TIGR04073 family)